MKQYQEMKGIKKNVKQIKMDHKQVETGGQQI